MSRSRGFPCKNAVRTSTELHFHPCMTMTARTSFTVSFEQVVKSVFISDTSSSNPLATSLTFVINTPSFYLVVKTHRVIIKC